MAVHAFTSGPILTMDPQHRRVEVVIIDGDRVLAVGGRDLLEAHASAVVHDLRGRHLLPGFIDAHNHLSIAALHPRWVDVSACRDMDELAAALRMQAEREPVARWIRAANWDVTVAGLLPERAQLDALGFDRPVMLAHFSLHQCMVDSRGLDELGIGRHTSDPDGGMILRDDRGEPTGVLVERAWSTAHARSMADYRNPDRWAELIAARARELLRDGITCVHDAACPPSAEAVYASMRRSGRLPISVLMMPHPEAILTNDYPERLDGPITGEGEEWLRVGPMKFFADGGIAPAIDACVGGQRNALGITFADLSRHLERAARRGFRVAVHAMGNAGLAAALEAFTRAARARDTDHRFRIEHATLASRRQMDAMRALGAVAVVQPGFVHHMGALVDGVVFDEEIWLPFGELQHRGVPMAASSDHPCAAYEPLRTSAIGTTRRTRFGGILDLRQSVAYEDWLHAYTIGAAYAGGQEHERGSLMPGKRADLVIVAGDLNAERPPTVSETWVAGEQVFAANTASR